jgi:cephalosporin-C deacetylase-like acetyl esterase
MSLHPDYPHVSEVDGWCESLVRRAEGLEPAAELTPGPESPFKVRHAAMVQFARFSRPGASDWYGLWQPVVNGGPAPLLVHVPGYGGEMSLHPQFVAAGFNVLHINPLGYCTPKGLDESKRVEGTWPVLPDTVLSGGERGYADWLTDALVSIRWAMRQPQVQANRLGTFGTSQGGGGALLLASLLRDKVRACAADEPFLTGFAMMHGRGNLGAYDLAFKALNKSAGDAGRQRAGWRGMGTIDTISHAHRLTMPTLLTAGKIDMVCPSDTIQALFERLPATRAYMEMAGMAHGYTQPFGEVAKAWLTLYV